MSGFFDTGIGLHAEYAVAGTNARKTGQDERHADKADAANVFVESCIGQPDSAKNSNEAIDTTYIFFQHDVFSFNFLAVFKPNLLQMFRR